MQKLARAGEHQPGFISSDDSCSKAILRVVRHRNGLLFGAECCRCQNGSKNFLPPQPVLGLHINENSGLNEVALGQMRGPLPTRQQGCAFRVCTLLARMKTAIISNPPEIMKISTTN